MKRVFDIFLTVLTLPLWLPLLLVVAIVITVIEGRPIFFKQNRAGLNERPFQIIKFRTMRCGSESDATRITRLGKFLRASSLDELPELFLVISGKMSLVGPRPLPVEYLERYSESQKKRHLVKPGITGWAQIHGRNATTWEERLNHDIWYVENKSFLLDLKILFLTVWTVFRASGINNSNSDTMPEFKG